MPPSYATTQDAIDLYGEDYILVSGDRDDSGDADVPGFSDSLDQATSELNSYLGVVYDLPLVTVPQSLKRFCVDMAVYISSADPTELTEEKTKRYERAISWCKEVAAGKASLGTAEPPASVDEQGGSVQTSFPNTRIFTRTRMGGIL